MDTPLDRVLVSDERSASYGTSRVRRRATAAEMDARRDALVEIVADGQPMSVRHAYYRAFSDGLVEKDQGGYLKVQREVLRLRREGRIPFASIVDNTRWMRRVPTYDSVADAIAEVAEFYRRDLWTESPYRVEVWCESDSIAGVVLPITEKWAVPLMVTRGYSSETFSYNAAQDWTRDLRYPVVLYVGDWDPHGVEIEESLRTKLGVFYLEMRPHSRLSLLPDPDSTGSVDALIRLRDNWVDRIRWTRVGITPDQVDEHGLHATGHAIPAHKRKPSFPDDIAFEAEALPASVLRAELEYQIEQLVDELQLGVLQEVERSEREVLETMAATVRGAE